MIKLAIIVSLNLVVRYVSSLFSVTNQYETYSIEHPIVPHGPSSLTLGLRAVLVLIALSKNINYFFSTPALLLTSSLIEHGIEYSVIRRFYTAGLLVVIGARLA